jgi:hypothetical protein
MMFYLQSILCREVRGHTPLRVRASHRSHQLVCRCQVDPVARIFCNLVIQRDLLRRPRPALSPANTGEWSPTRSKYSPCCLTWPLSTECAVDLVESTYWDKGCRVCTGFNGAVVAVCHPPSNPECSCSHCPTTFCRSSNAQPRSQG